MNKAAFDKICTLLDQAEVVYRVFEHEPCKTSEESMAARKKAGVEGAIGAKALLCKLYFPGRELFATLVLPGSHILDKKLLKNAIPELKLMRFVTSEELLSLAGVASGCMPPFGSQVFPDIERLYIAEALKDFPRLAFNAAYFEKSITLESEHYFKAVKADQILNFSVPKAI